MSPGSDTPPASPLLAVRRAVGRDVISACRAILERRLALGLAVRERDEWAHERAKLEGLASYSVVEWTDACVARVEKTTPPRPRL